MLRISFDPAINQTDLDYALNELTKVIDIPYDEVSDIYTVTLLDGRKIQCTDGHLFKVKNHKTKRIEIKPLIEIIKDYKKGRNVNA